MHFLLIQHFWERREPALRILTVLHKPVKSLDVLISRRGLHVCEVLGFLEGN